MGVLLYFRASEQVLERFFRQPAAPVGIYWPGTNKPVAIAIRGRPDGRLRASLSLLPQSHLLGDRRENAVGWTSVQ
jgi:hypothetical protein